MDIIEQRALQNAAASSAMEGLPLEQRHLEIIQTFLLQVDFGGVPSKFAREGRGKLTMQRLYPR